MRGRAHGRPHCLTQARGRDRRRSFAIKCWRRQPITGSGECATSRCCAIFQTPFILSPPAPSTPSGRGSQTELAQGSSSTSWVQLKRITSLHIERDQLASRLSNAIQRLSEVEQKLYFIEFENRAFVATVDLQESTIRTLKAKMRVSKSF